MPPARQIGPRAPESPPGGRPLMGRLGRDAGPGRWSRLARPRRSPLRSFPGRLSRFLRSFSASRRPSRERHPGPHRESAAGMLLPGRGVLNHDCSGGVIPGRIARALPCKGEWYCLGRGSNQRSTAAELYAMADYATTPPYAVGWAGGAENSGKGEVGVVLMVPAATAALIASLSRQSNSPYAARPFSPPPLPSRVAPCRRLAGGGPGLAGVRRRPRPPPGGAQDG